MMQYTQVSIYLTNPYQFYHLLFCPFFPFFELILILISGMSSPESFELSGDRLLCDLAVVEALTQDFLFDVNDIREL